MTPDETRLLGSVPEDGAPAGNISLMRDLKWTPDHYWKVRDQLLADGILVRGRGKGGSVRRATGDVPVIAVAKPPSAGADEFALYEPLLKTLRGEWSREMGLDEDQIFVESRPRLGRTPTGGTWTRPDISAVSVRTFQHLPNRYLDVWTFEVKPSLDITGIYEAAAHGSRATRSYALLQVVDSQAVAELLDRCEREAARLRVGLITFADPSLFDTWETIVEAPRLDTAPELLEEFIAQLSDVAKKRLARWK